jgi:hypothetical protein
MNKLVIALTAVCYAAFFSAQTGAYVQLKKAIELSHPEISTENKLIAFNIWSLADPESREANKSFEKVYHTYEYAKLKGGRRGIVVVMISKDNLSGTAVITLHKDGVDRSVSVKAEDLPEISAGAATNMVFDSNGNEVYRNLPAGKVFSEIQQLITR